MQLYFLRHADAEEQAPTDAQRKLTEKGVEQSKTVAAFCQKHGIKPAFLFTSPVVRAKQTADIVAKALGLKPKVCRWLACGMRPDTLVENLMEYTSAESVMLVGHEPDFGMSVCHLLGTAAPAAHLRKASLTCVGLGFVREGSGVLEFSIPNRFM